MNELNGTSEHPPEIHPLLRAFPRRVVPVKLSGRTDLKVYVLVLTVGEDERSIDLVKHLEGKEIVLQLLADHVCDEGGKLLLTLDQARQFVEVVYNEDLTAIMTEIHNVRSLGKDALEKTEKN